MEPEMLRWYSSVAGVVAATIAIVQMLKSTMPRVEYLNLVPTWTYVVTVAALLTWFSHDVLGTLHGENLVQLITEAVTAALVASGAVEMWRTKTKPIADSNGRADSRFMRDFDNLSNLRSMALPLAGAILLSGCAARGTLVKADSTMALTLVGIQSEFDTMLELQVITLEKRQQLGRYLLPALDASQAFNRAVRASSVDAAGLEFGRLSRALALLIQKVVELVPPEARGPTVDRIREASDLAVQLMGGVK
jgi:hypothetical protein